MTGQAMALVLSRLPGARRVGKEFCARCPAHEDKAPSLGIREADDGRVLLICRAGCSADAVCGALGLTTADLFAPRRGVAPQVSSTFDRDAAGLLWSQARSRVLDDLCVEKDWPVYEYLNGRRLSKAWEERAYGIVARGMPLPDAARAWPTTGHQVIAPLYDLQGRLASIQARRIRNGDPKVLFPRGARAKGVVFANAAGLHLLRRELTPDAPVIFGEGLTDHLAFSITTSMPTLCAPGTSNARSCVGAWARNRSILLALDCDRAGDAAVSEVANLAYEHRAVSVRRIRWGSDVVDACDALWRMGAPRMSEFLDALREVEHGAA